MQVYLQYAIGVEDHERSSWYNISVVSILQVYLRYAIGVEDHERSSWYNEKVGDKDLINTKFYIKNINYDTIVELTMPYVVQWLSEKDNLFYDILKSIISKKGKPSKFSKLLVSIIPKKTDMTAALLPHFDDVLVEYLNNLLMKNGVTAKITSIDFDSMERRQETMLKIEITIDNIDYDKTVEGLLPVILQKLSEKEEKSSRIAKILKSLDGLPGNMVKGALGAIPKGQRDELAVMLLTEFRDELTETLNTVVNKNHIEAEISEIKFDSK
jgi:hypothetical protein